MDIKVPNRKYDVSSIVSVNAPVFTQGAGTFKAGHLVVHDGTMGYQASAVDAAILEGKPVGVLLEDVTLEAMTPVTAKVAIAGRVWISFVRDAGFTEEVVSDDQLRALSALQTQILFLDAKEATYAE